MKTFYWRTQKTSSTVSPLPNSFLQLIQSQTQKIKRWVSFSVASRLFYKGCNVFSPKSAIHKSTFNPCAHSAITNPLVS